MARVNIENRNNNNRNTTNNDFFSNKKFYLILILLILQTIFLGYKNFDYIFGSLFESNNDITIISENSNPENSLKSKKTLEKKLNRKKNLNKKNSKNEINNSKVISKKNKTKPKLLSAPVTINIKNACGVSGIAAKWQKILRKVKYDVIEALNAKRINKSMIICRNIKMKPDAIKLANLLEIDENQIVIQPSKTVIVDLELIIGRDYKKLKLPK